MKEVYLQSLEAREIHAIGSTEHLSALGPGFFKKYIRLVKQQGIVFHDILTHASEESGRELREALKGMYDQAYLPREYDDFPTDILIWDDHVALITLSDPIFGTVITNPMLAKTFRMMFSAIKKGLSV